MFSDWAKLVERAVKALERIVELLETDPRAFNDRQIEDEYLRRLMAGHYGPEKMGPAAVEAQDRGHEVAKRPNGTFAMGADIAAEDQRLRSGGSYGR